MESFALCRTAFTTFPEKSFLASCIDEVCCVSLKFDLPRVGLHMDLAKWKTSGWKLTCFTFVLVCFLSFAVAFLAVLFFFSPTPPPPPHFAFLCLGHFAPRVFFFPLSCFLFFVMCFSCFLFLLFFRSSHFFCTLLLFFFPLLLMLPFMWLLSSLCLGLSSFLLLLFTF